MWVSVARELELWWLMVVWQLVELQWKESEAGGGAASKTLTTKLI
jgi:hypothetical protein